MKLKRLIAALLVAVALLSNSGCSTFAGAKDAAFIDRILNEILAPEFTGDAYFAHSNPYFNGSIRAGNLRKGPSGRWLWDWLIYSRDGMGSDGSIIFGTPPAHFLLR